MLDAKPSAVSRILRLFSAPAQTGKKSSEEPDSDNIPGAAEIERKLAERDEAFFWTWQYPGQW
jgi:hypothetical protein